MATIKAITLAEKSATVSLDDGSTFTLHLEAYLKAALREGLTLDAAALETLKHTSSFFEALDQSYRWLSFKAYTVRALSDRLKETWEPFIVTQVITQLTHEQYLDDERYLNDRLDEALQFDYKGPKHYQNAWFKLGFTKPNIDAALASVSESIWHERCLNVMQKALDQAKALPRQALKDKASLKAQRLGYSFAHIEAVVSQLVFPNVDTHRLIQETLQKLKVNVGTLTATDKHKLIQKLLRQGFSYDAIKDVLS